MKTHFDIEVKKDLYITAAPGESVWMTSTVYTDASCKCRLEAVLRTRHDAVRGAEGPDAPKYYYYALNHRRLTFDDGASWEDQPPLEDRRDGLPAKGVQVESPLHFLDPGNGMIVSVRHEHEFDYSRGGLQWGGAGNVWQTTSRIFCEISRDAGRTWSPSAQVIQSGPGFDKINWLPGITSGVNGAMIDTQPPVKTDDGTLLCPFTRFLGSRGARSLGDCDHGLEVDAGFLRGRWRGDLSGIDWELGAYVDDPGRPSGLCETFLLCLGGNRVLASFRSMGNQKRGIPSQRMMSVTEDAGKTWSRPSPLTYDDGSPFWVSSCPMALTVSPATGRVYIIGAILDKPSYSACPRPLLIAEFDRDKLSVRKGSVRSIQNVTDEMPERRRYSNFAHYTDARTGELVLIMPEEPKTSWDDYTADTVRFKVRLIED